MKPAEPIALSKSEKKELLEVARGVSTPPRILLRVQIVLAAAEGIGNCVIARKLCTTVPTVLRWRSRYASDGIRGILRNRPQSGRPKYLGADLEETIVKATLTTRPKDGSRWTIRRMANSNNVNYAFVFRVWRKHGLKPYLGILG